MSSNQPLVSVVMSCYNCEQYLKFTIDSILNQTYTDFEFIIWDDGSTDSTREIISSYKDERIRYFYHENTGLGSALKMACEKANGKYIARMDGDDIAFCSRFQKEVDYMESHHDYVLVSSAVEYIDDKGTLIGRSFPCTIDSVIKHNLNNRGNMIVHPMVMMRRDAYISAGGYPNLMFQEDWLLWSRLAMLGKFHNIPTPLGQYRLLKSSLSRSDNAYKGVLFEYIRKMVKDPILLDSDIDLYNRIYKFSKQFISPIEAGIEKREEALNYRFYKILRPLLGEHLSQGIVTVITNLHHLLKVPIKS